MTGEGEKGALIQHVHSPSQMVLFGGPQLLGGPWAFLPQVTRDGEGIDAHGHGFGRDGGELFAVGAVLVDGLDHGGADDAGPDASEAYHLLRLGVHGVHRPELAARVTEQDQEVVGCALLHFLYNLVFLRFVDLARQAAPRDGIVDNKFVGLETRLLVQLWSSIFWNGGGRGDGGGVLPVPLPILSGHPPWGHQSGWRVRAAWRLSDCQRPSVPSVISHGGEVHGGVGVHLVEF